MQDKIIDDITKFVFVNGKAAKCDAIFLPGGSFAELPEAGARLYLDGTAPTVIPSGRYSVKSGSFVGVSSMADKYNKKYATECEFYTDVLTSLGVPLEAIIPEDRAMSTRDNARFSGEVCEKHGLRIAKAVICCKSFHARRCLMYYQMAFPETELTVAPVEFKGLSRDDWFQSSEGISMVLGELSKCGWQMTELLPQFMKFN